MNKSIFYSILIFTLIVPHTTSYASEILESTVNFSDNQEMFHYDKPSKILSGTDSVEPTQHEGKDFINLIDENIYTSWSTSLTSSETKSMILIYDRPISIKSYLISSGNRPKENDPKKWSLFGKNDQGEWESIDERDNIIFSKPNSTNHFLINSTDLYSEFKIDIKNNGGKELTISSIELRASDNELESINIELTGGGGMRKINPETATPDMLEEQNERMKKIISPDAMNEAISFLKNVRPQANLFNPEKALSDFMNEELPYIIRNVVKTVLYKNNIDKIPTRYHLGFSKLDPQTPASTEQTGEKGVYNIIMNSDIFAKTDYREFLFILHHEITHSLTDEIKKSTAFPNASYTFEEGIGSAVAMANGYPRASYFFYDANDYQNWDVPYEPNASFLHWMQFFSSETAESDFLPKLFMQLPDYFDPYGYFSSKYVEIDGENKNAANIDSLFQKYKKFYEDRKSQINTPEFRR